MESPCAHFRRDVVCSSTPDFQRGRATAAGTNQIQRVVMARALSVRAQATLALVCGGTLNP